MKKILLASVALSMTAGFAMAEAHGKTIRMGTEGAYPPYNFINDAGGSLCELEEPAVLEQLAQDTLIIYLKPSTAMLDQIIERLY